MSRDGTDASRAAGRAVISRTFAKTVQLHETVAGLDPTPTLDVVDAIVASLVQGGKLLAFGNGGSAADAQHLAAELVSRYLIERAGLAAVALTTDTSILTAIANDYDYDRVFARQIEALGRAGDVAFGISTSGRSRSVVAGLQAARAAGLVTVALTGSDGGAVGQAADLHLNVPDPATPRVQEVHRTLLHVICELVEARLANQ